MEDALVENENVEQVHTLQQEKLIKELQEKLSQSSYLRQSEIEDFKSRLIIERHERDKDQNNHGVMIKELQKLLGDERRAKEHLETQVEDLSVRVAEAESLGSLKDHYEKRLRDLHNELEATHRKLKRTENKAKEPPPLLLELQEEMSNLKVHHQAAILQVLKAERMRHKEELMACESQNLSHLSQLEQQLQKQRERSLVLLEEKEQELKTLKSTFQMFLPDNKNNSLQDKNVTDGAEVVDDVMSSLSQFGGVVRGGGGESPHMLHYVHELARRDVEISNQRRSRHQLESSLRELQKVAFEKEEKANKLQEQVTM
uniref:Uncharacterized protein n=1 Tax=Timema genevievae TaxID=629358 RepID=A0A7R9JU35_TIMGE|nr:unnamed protein product [Timema genevievae]